MKLFKKCDYESAIVQIKACMEQLEPNGKNCSLCGDNDHQAFECTHNPLVALERIHEYKCFFCGNYFSGKDAEDHFGLTENDNPKCITVLMSLINKKNKEIEKLTEYQHLAGEYCEKNQKLVEAINGLIHHFNDYGLEEESFVLVMEVEKARTVLRELGYLSN